MRRVARLRPSVGNALLSRLVQVPLVPALIALPLIGCNGDKEEDTGAPSAPPMGMVLAEDGVLYAGVSRVDLTPEIIETYTDLNGNNEFDGCNTDPTGTRPGCDEPYDDVNGDGHFDGIWIAGFQSKRAAMGVHDPITATALVLSLDGDYVALVGIDALGILENRTRDLRDLLEAEGFDRDRVLVSSSHSHCAPDTVGIWGLDTDYISGTYAPFMDTLVPGMFDALTAATSTMVPVTATQGITYMSEGDPTLNGEPFGGVNPDPSVAGGLNDIRDPIIAADAVWALALDGADGARVATVVSASGHPETSGSDHSLLSSDYVGYMRDYLDRVDGGTTLFLSGSLGGMQSALGSTLPAIDTDGNRVLDDAGDPVWVAEASGEGDWEFARTWGTLVAQAAQAALTDTGTWDGISVTMQEFIIPVDNLSFKLAFQVGLLDTPNEYVIQDATCPNYGVDADVFGCIPAAAWMVRLGPNTLASVPGELMPELFYGVPDEPAMTTASARVGDRRWVQWDPDCNTVEFADCKANVGSVGECDCLKDHVTPYHITDSGTAPIADLLPGTYKQPIGITNAYCGYIVPVPDFNTGVSVLTEDGDHYEETNSCTASFGDLVLDAYLQLTAG